MTFDEALQKVNEGKKIIRKIWEENGLPRPNFHGEYIITKDDANANDWICYDETIPEMIREK